MKRRIVYISRNYKRLHCAGGIARSSIEKILSEMGAVNLGLSPTFVRNGIYHGVRNFAGMMKALAGMRKGDVLVVQYPLKIYVPLILRMAKKKGIETVALLIDLDSFREKQLTPAEEVALLNKFDVVLTHNVGMRKWLEEHGCISKLIDYEIMDYLHGESTPLLEAPENRNYSLYYVGNLTREDNGFLYELASLMPETDIYLYGPDYDRELCARLPNIHTPGFVQDTEIIERHSGDFGLSWYGSSLDDAIGKLGEYMNVNNPYKVGLYLRANTPVIVWKRAGRAEFIEREGIGIAVDSLRELPGIFASLPKEGYEAMVGRVEKVNRRLASGFYLRDAMRKVMEYLEEREA